MPLAPIRLPGILKPTAGAGGAKLLQAFCAISGSGQIFPPAFITPAKAGFCVARLVGNGGQQNGGSDSTYNYLNSGSGGAKAMASFPIKPGVSLTYAWGFYNCTLTRGDTGQVVVQAQNGQYGGNNTGALGQRGLASACIGDLCQDGVDAVFCYQQRISDGATFNITPAAGFPQNTFDPRFGASLSNVAIATPYWNGSATSQVNTTPGSPAQTGSVGGLISLEFWTADPRGTAA